MRQPLHVARNVAESGIKPINGWGISAAVTGRHPFVKKAVESLLSHCPLVKVISLKYWKVPVEMCLVSKNAADTGQHVAIGPHQLALFGSFVFLGCGVAGAFAIRSLASQMIR